MVLGMLKISELDLVGYKNINMIVTHNQLA